jgi:hypothetical protein
MSQTLTTEIIRVAIEGYEAQKARIEGKIADLRALLPGESVNPSAPGTSNNRKRRRISATARARMAEAQRRRWETTREQAADRKSTGAGTSAPGRKKG